MELPFFPRNRHPATGTVLALVASTLLACTGGQTGESPLDPRQDGPVEPGPGGPRSPKPDEPGGPGGPGAEACRSDDECLAQFQGLVDALSGPETRLHDHAAGTCGRGSVGKGFSSWGGDSGEPTCLCGDEDSGMLLSAGPSDLCLAYSRDRSCLYAADAFPGCDLEQPEDSCDALCEALDASLQADAQRVIDARIEAARCYPGACHAVLRIDDACYVDQALAPHDCARDPNEVLEARFGADGMPEPPVPSCEELDGNSGGGTCVEEAPGEDCYHPRDPAEWQGALVDVCLQIECVDFCGLRLACVDGVCGACERDDQCLTGEVCVLDQCILDEQAECRSQADCDPGVVCLFVDEDDTPAEPRGNLGTWAICNTQERLNDFHSMGDSD